MRRAWRRIGTVLVTSALILGLSPAAFATVIEIDGPGDVSGPGPGSGPPSGGGDDGGGGGTISHAITESGVVWGNPASKTLRASGSPIKVGSPTPTVACRGGNQWGDYLGMRWSTSTIVTTQSGDNGGGAVQRYHLLSSWASSCVDAPHFKDITLKCIQYYSAEEVGPRNNPNVKSKTTDKGTKRSPFGKNQTRTNCGKSSKAEFRSETQVLGQHKMTGYGWGSNCTWRVYTTNNARTGDRPDTEFFGCGKVKKVVGPVSVKWQITCNRQVQQKWTNADFTTDACKSTTEKPTKWTCDLTTSQKTPYVGKVKNSKPVDVLRNGKYTLIEWRKQPAPTGSMIDAGSISARKVKFTFDKTSTPYNAGQALDSNKQRFATSPTLNVLKSGWQAQGSKEGRTGLKARFFLAGKKGENWKAGVTWAFTAKFAYDVVDTVDLEAGTVTTKKKWVRNLATCEGAATNIPVIRSRIIN